MKAYYRKRLHGNSVFSIFINPYYFARKGLYISLSKYANRISGKVLDIGCGNKPYEVLFDVSEYIGLEIDTAENRVNKSADYYYDGKLIPFQDESYDGILCNQVLEHVFMPTNFIKEVSRVLKVDGKLLLSVPFVWDEHEQPVDYARYSSFGLRYMLESNGFEILSSDKTCADISIIFQLINAYIYKVLHTKYISINLIYTIILIAPVNILGFIFSKLLPRNIDLYLDNVVLAVKRK